jgi:hypothetical protein
VKEEEAGAEDGGPHILARCEHVGNDSLQGKDGSKDNVRNGGPQQDVNHNGNEEEHLDQQICHVSHIIDY